MDTKNRNTNLYIIIARVFVTVALCVAVLVSPQLQHWFVGPIFLASMLLIGPATKWLIGNVDFLDPIGLMAAFLLYTLCFAPIAIVAMDFWLPYIPAPNDYRTQIGILTLCYLVGLVPLMVVQKMRGASVSRTFLRINPTRFWMIGLTLLLVSFCLQVYVYYKFNGISGYIAAHELNKDKGGMSENFAFRGYGAIFAISESFPMLLIIALCRLANTYRQFRTFLWVCAAISVFTVAAILFGGLRGSRANICYAVFQAIGLIHIFAYRVRTPLMIAFVAPLFVVFMMAYGAYKWGGTDALLGRTSVATSSSDTRGSLPYVMFIDLSRVQIQAKAVERATSPNDTLKLAYGRTYVAAIASLIPRFILSNRMPNKVMEGTNMIYGEGSYREGEFMSQLVYGLAGEAMLNFGLVGVPLSMAVYIGFVYWVSRRVSGLNPEDSRWYLVPFVTLFAVVLFLADLDVALAFVMKWGLVPAIWIYASSDRRKVVEPSGDSLVGVAQ